MELREYLAGTDFSSYERAAILFLSTVECATARQVVSRARIPQGRIYDVLTGLVERSIVQRRAGSPQQFTIPDVAAALTNHLRKQRRELHEREALLSTVLVPKRTVEPSKPTSGVVLYTGRSQHILATIALRDAALVTLDEYAPQFAGGYASQRSVLDACARGVRMRILIHKRTAENSKAIAAAVASGAHVRYGVPKDFPPVRVRDGEEVLFLAQDHERSHEPLALRTEQRALVLGFSDQFEKAWRLAKPVHS